MVLERHSSGDLDPGAFAIGNANVQVVVRVRPPNERENDLGYHKCVAVDHGSKSLQLLLKPQPKGFSFDYIADEDKRQDEIFMTVGKPITDACLQGYHCCLLAYGQTGAGKTFTMEGPDYDGDGESSVNSMDKRGLIPRILQYIFQKLSADKELKMLEFTIRCSYLQIYNEQVSDLLEPDSINLNVREDLRHGMFVEGLQEVVVSTAEATYALFKRGSQNRRVGQTAMNMESSRSHSVFTIVVETQRRDDAGVMNRKMSRFHLVDLAGSERQRQSEAQGVRLKEAGSINKSLSALGNVIKALVDIAEGKIRHVPYRDSKLTFLLKDSLGGNSKCTLIAAVSPAERNIEETLSTLKFAQRAKLMHNEAVVNELMMGNPAVMGEEIRRLRLEIAELRANATSGVAGQPLLPPSPSSAPMSENQRMQRLEHIISQSTKRALEAEREAAHELAKQQKRAEAAEALAEGLVRTTQGLKMVVKLRDERIRRVEEQGSCGGQCVQGEDRATLEEMKQEVAVLKRMLERNPDAIRFRLEVDVCKARIRELEEQVQHDTSDSHKVAALESLNANLREELKEAFDECEKQRGQVEDLERERNQLRANLVGMEEHVKKVAAVAEQYRQEVNSTRQLQRSVNERKQEYDDARLRCGVAEAKVRKLLEQLEASQRTESLLKVQAAEQATALKAALQSAEKQLAASQTAEAVSKVQAATEAAQLRTDLNSAVESAQEQLAASQKAEAVLRVQAAEAVAEATQLRADLEVAFESTQEQLAACQKAEALLKAQAAEAAAEAAEEATKLRTDLEAARVEAKALLEEKERAMQRCAGVEAAATERVRELDAQRHALEEEIEGLKSRQVELEEKVQALEQERELLWAASERGAGNSGEAGGDNNEGEKDERIETLEEELQTEKERVKFLAEKIGDRDGLWEAACERQRRAEEAVERVRREAEEYAAEGRELQQVNRELEEKLSEALKSLQEAKDRVAWLEDGVTGQGSGKFGQGREEQEQEERDEQKRWGGGGSNSGSGGKRRWQEALDGGAGAVEGGGEEEEGVLSPMTLCLSELQDVTNRLSPLQGTGKADKASSTVGGRAGAGAASGSAPSPVQLGMTADEAAAGAAEEPVLAASSLANRWTLPLLGETSGAGSAQDGDMHRCVGSELGGEVGRGTRGSGSLGRKMERKRRRRSAPVSQTEVQAEKLRVMETQVRHMVRQLAAAHAEVKGLSGKMQKAGPVMVRMRDVVQQLRAKGQALELALLQTVERVAVMEAAEQEEEGEKEVFGEVLLRLRETNLQLQMERDEFLQQVMVLGPRNAVLCEELGEVRKRLEASRDAMGEMEGERERLRGTLGRLMKNLGSWADVEGAGEEAGMADVDAALAVVREEVGRIERSNWELGEQVKALEKRCKELQGEAEGRANSRKAVAVGKTGSEEMQGAGSSVKGESTGQEGAELQEGAEKGRVKQVEELMARLTAAEEYTKEVLARAAVAEQRCSELHARVAAVVARERALQKLLVSPLLGDAGASGGVVGSLGAGAKEEIVEGWKLRWQQLEQEQLKEREQEEEKEKAKQGQDHQEVGEGSEQGRVVREDSEGVNREDTTTRSAEAGPEQRRMQVEEVRGAVAQLVLVESLLAVLLCRAGLAGLSSRISSRLESGPMIGDRGSVTGAGTGELGTGLLGVGGLGGIGKEGGSETEEVGTDQVAKVLDALQKQRLLLLGFLGVKSEESSHGDKVQARLDGMGLLEGLPTEEPESGSGGIQSEGGLTAEAEEASPSEGLTLPSPAEVTNQVKIAQWLVHAGIGAAMACDDACWLRGSVLRGVYVLREMVREVEGKVAGWEVQWGELEHTCQQQAREILEVGRAVQRVQAEKREVERALREREEELAERSRVVERTVSVAADAVEIEKEMVELVGRQQQVVGAAAGEVDAGKPAFSEPNGGMVVARAAAVGEGTERIDLEGEIRRLQQLKEEKEREVVGWMKRVTEMEAQGRGRWEEALQLHEEAARQVEGLEQRLKGAQLELVGQSARADELAQKVEQLEGEVKEKNEQIASLHKQLVAAVEDTPLNSPRAAPIPSSPAATAIPASEPRLGQGQRKRQKLSTVLSAIHGLGNREKCRSPLFRRRAGTGKEDAAVEGELVAGAKQLSGGQQHLSGGQYTGPALAACSRPGWSGVSGPSGSEGAAGAASGGAGGEGEEFFTPMSHWSISSEDAGFSAFGGAPQDSTAAGAGATAGSVKGGRGKAPGWGVGHGGASGGSAKKRGWGSGAANCVGSNENVPLIPEGPLSGDFASASGLLPVPPVGGSASKVTVRAANEEPLPFSRLSGRRQQYESLSGEKTPRGTHRGPAFR